MRRRYMRRALPLGLVVALAGCAVNPVSGRPEVVLISTSQERELGRVAAKQVEASMGFVDEPRLTAYVRDVGARVATHSPYTGIEYTFNVVDIAEPNAFALPGGYVYVSRGLLALMSSEDELAGVIGHEVGHVAARHAVRRVSHAAPIGVASGVGAAVAGMVSPVLGDVVSGVGSLSNELILAPYDRDQEREADHIGAELSAKAGWDPNALAAYLRTLERETQLGNDGASNGLSFFATHPPLPERVENVTAFARDLPRAPGSPIAATPQDFIERLDGLVVGKSAAEGDFLGELFVHPELDFAIAFPTGWKTQNTREAVGAGEPHGQATIVVDLAGNGDDPMQALAAIDRASGSDLATHAERTTIGGLRAAHATTEMRADRERLVVDVTCVAHRGQIFRIVGATRPDTSNEFAKAFRTTAQAFRAPTPAELSRLRETRLRLARGRGGETLEELVARTRSAWKPEMVAVANGLAVSSRLAEGQLVKIAVSEPYVKGR
jgi:predicted Zn-dependent protease